MVHIIHWDDNNIWWGSFKREVANCPLSLELSQCFPCQLCFLPPPKCGWGHPLPMQERCFPLESRLPLCFDSGHNAWEWLFLPSLGTEGVGELRGKARLIILVVSQPAMFSRWSKISYLFWFSSPCGWIMVYVRVSVALCHVMSSEGWRKSWCMSPLQCYARWLLLYLYSVFQVLDNIAVVSVVAADNEL